MKVDKCAKGAKVRPCVVPHLVSFSRRPRQVRVWRHNHPDMLAADPVIVEPAQRKALEGLPPGRNQRLLGCGPSSGGAEVLPTCFLPIAAVHAITFASLK
jgi:hypothetical protein